MKTKKIILGITVILILVVLGTFMLKTADDKKVDDSKIRVVTSNFASYDFLRAIVGESKNVEIKFLIGPGKDAHSYDPTAKDLIAIQNADLFVYLGGETEKWSDKVLDTIENDKVKVICIADFVDTIKEQEVDGAEEKEEEEEEGAFDEHIWTSPTNSIKMVEALEKAMEEIDNENSTKYKENADGYIAQIIDLDTKIQEIVDNRIRDRLIFGDRMPMQYFVNYYGLKVSAAFPGCSTETEPSARTIAYLERKVKEEKIPVVLYIELNNGRVAKTIAKEAGNECEALQIQTLHNVSLDDFNAGETWVSLMNRNLEILKKALQ